MSWSGCTLAGAECRGHSARVYFGDSQLGTKPTRLQDILAPGHLGPKSTRPPKTRPQDISALVNSAPELYLVYKQINEST